jgi:hypothetical protein
MRPTLVVGVLQACMQMFVDVCEQHHSMCFYLPAQALFKDTAAPPYAFP